MRARFSIEELQTLELSPPFSFTKGCKLMKIKASDRGGRKHQFETKLFDLKKDPKQEKPIDDPEIEQKMISNMIKLMKANNCPEEQFERLGLEEE